MCIKEQRGQVYSILKYCVLDCFARLFLVIQYTGTAVPGNLVGQHPIFAARPLHVPMDHWHQNTPSGVPPRPQFIPYSSNVAAPFPGVLHPSIPFSSSQPPRANPAFLSNQPLISPSAPVLQIRNDFGMMSDPPPGTGMLLINMYLVSNFSYWPSHFYFGIYIR